MSDINAQVQRLEAARQKVDEIKERRTRLMAQKETHESALSRMETECQDKFGVSVEELPDTIEKLEADAEAALSKAEKALGLS